MTPLEIANTYYAAFSARSDFQEVPMADTLRFVSPMMVIDGPDGFRQTLQALAQQVQGLEVRHQLAAGDAVVTVYDFDMGLPDGPVAMSEVLTVRGGEIRDVELIFDSKRLAPAA